MVGFLVGAAFARGADSSLADARRAQAELGPASWSQVIRIENGATPGRYPRTLHALVFELAGILWFYTDVDGTQSLSLRRGRLAEDKADLAPLLRAIEPGFARWRIVTDEAPAPAARRGELPNGCFIDSVAALRARCEHGEVTLHAQLLSFYIDTPEGRRGHTVLTYDSGRAFEVVDPFRPGKAQRFSPDFAGDALRLARVLGGERVTKARWLPVELPTARNGLFALGGADGGGDFGDATVLNR